MFEKTIFLLFSFFGEDPVRIVLGSHASEQAIAELREQWGLDKSLFYQFIEYLIQIIKFDYGVSFISGESIIEIFKQGALVSLALTAPPFFFGTIINIFLAVIIAYYRGSIMDKLSTMTFVVSMSISYLVYIIIFLRNAFCINVGTNYINRIFSKDDIFGFHFINFCNRTCVLIFAFN